MRVARGAARVPAGPRDGRALGRPGSGGGAPDVNELPDPATFLSGERGEAGSMAGAGDLWLDARLLLGGAARRLDRVEVPPREVLVMSVYRPGRERLSRALEQLASDTHRVALAFGSMGEATVEGTVATQLSDGKFPNLNAVREAAGDVHLDWTVVVVDD